MRKLFLFCCLIPLVTFAQNNRNNDKDQPRNFHHQPLGAAETWDDFRDIDEVNDTLTADAYPYLSADGLRLYFVSEREGTESFYVAERTSKERPFGKPIALSTGLDTASNFSIWLDNDELESYFIARNSSSNSIASTSLFRSKRESLTADFQAAEAIKLTGAPIRDFFAGPSLSPDKRELFLFHNYFAANAIYRFSKVGDLEYEFLDSLSLPAGFNPGPGQLSKDGLKYIFSNFNDNSLYYMSRERLWYSFKQWSLTKLDGDLTKDTTVMVGLPSITADEDQIVCVHYDYNSWGGNELMIVEGRLAEDAQYLTLGASLAIYPNPAHESLRIRGNNVEFMQILGLDGKLLVQADITKSIENTIDVSNLSTGIYLIKVRDVDGQWLMNKFVKE